MVVANDVLAYAIFPIHPVSPDFLTQIVSQSCPDADAQIIDALDFTSQSYQSLAKRSAEHFSSPSSPFQLQPSVFVVVDDRSEADNSIVIVSLAKDDSLHVLGAVRVDVYFAGVIPSLIESEWNFIEEWIERAQESGGTLRDIPILSDGPEEPEEPSPTVSEFPDEPWEIITDFSAHSISDDCTHEDKVSTAGTDMEY